MSKLTHFDDKGRANMVDISEKTDTERRAVASGKVRLSKGALKALRSGVNKKGDVLTVAEIAGIMGAKKTSELIPLCHPLALTGMTVDLQVTDDGVTVTASVQTTGKTGVEMEALTAVSTACLTVYDMLKAVDKSMVITDIQLLEKSGGRSGHFRRTP